MRRNTAASSNEKSMTTSSSSPSNNNNTTTEFDDQKTSLLLSSSKMKPTYNPNVFPTFETLNLQAMKQKILDMKEEMKNLTNLTNYYRRIYYAESELMIMDIEYLLKLKTNYNFNDIELQLQEILEECTLISKQLKLQYSNKLTNNNNGNKRNILLYLLYKLDELSRSIAVFIFFIFSGLCLTLPCILLCIRSFDTWLVRNNIISPFNQISNTVKAFISHMILRISGIELNIEGFQSDYFGKDCSIICFSHSSTIDAFVITLAIPVRHYTLAKAELFLVPFFSWHLLAYGGIPIDRSNRDQAIEAIGIAAEAAGVGDTVAVSPEGTRSTTGQIVAFKKGPFHLWESLKTPIIPLVIYGAFDLLPPSNLMAIPGKVYARYLPPTYSTQAKTREEMSYLIRKQMLLAWKDGPKDAGNSLSWKSQLITQFYVFIVYLSTYLCYQYLPVYIILNKYNLSKMQLTGIITGFCIGITFLFYIYLLYLKPLFKRLIYGSKRRSTGSGAGSGSNNNNNNNSGIASSNGNTKESHDKE